jgi:hypothetical protein
MEFSFGEGDCRNSIAKSIKHCVILDMCQWPKIAKIRFDWHIIKNAKTVAP